MLHESTEDPAKKMASLLMSDFSDDHSEDEMDESQLKRRGRTYRRWARLTHVLRERIVNNAFEQNFLVSTDSKKHCPTRRTTLFGTVLGKYTNKSWWEGALSKRANFGFLDDGDFGEDVADGSSAIKDEKGETCSEQEINSSLAKVNAKGGRRSSVTMEFYLDPEKELMEVMQEIYNPAAVTAEENEFYTDEALLRREALQFDPSVRAALDKIWALIDEDCSGGLDKSEYKRMHRLMVHVLLGQAINEDQVPYQHSQHSQHR
jgi:hypothetical protein